MNELDSPNNKKLIQEKGLQYLVERFKERIKREVGIKKLESYGMNDEAFQ
jgi:hypothetical protein